MLEIKNLMEMIQSDDADKRYDACNQMKLLPTLPLEALEALRTAASKDEDPAVAEKAQETIKFHTTLTQQKEKQEKNILEDKEAEQLSYSPGILSTVIGVFLSISLFLLFNLPFYFSGTSENPLRDPMAQQIGSWALSGYFFVGLISILGIIIGRKGIRIKSKTPWLGITEWSWSWLGIIVNVFVLIATPMFWLALLVTLATA